jgi:hypothetical protein
LPCLEAMKIYLPHVRTPHIYIARTVRTLLVVFSTLVGTIRGWFDLNLYFHNLEFPTPMHWHSKKLSNFHANPIIYDTSICHHFLKKWKLFITCAK